MSENSQGMGGGGNSSNAVASPSSQGTPSGGNNFSGGSGGGNVIDLSEDSLVRVPGSKEPVKYGDYYRKFQSEFTRTSQEAAQARKEAQQYQARLAEYERNQRAQAEAARTQGQQKPNIAERIRSLQYLSGQDAAQVVEELQGHFGQFEQKLGQRDAALVLLYNQLKALAERSDTFAAKNGEAEFNSKIGNYLKGANLPEEAREFVAELYTAYEGPNLDQEFPDILKRRLEQLTKMVKSQAAAEAAAKRNNPFVPGKGGLASASRPGQPLAKMSAREIADLTWPTMVSGDVET